MKRMTRKQQQAEVAAVRDYAGLIQARHARENGALVVVIDDRQNVWGDESCGAWLTICERHGEIIQHDTRRLALHHAPNPTGWCEACRDEAVEEARLSDELDRSDYLNLADELSAGEWEPGVPVTIDDFCYVESEWSKRLGLPWPPPPCIDTAIEMVELAERRQRGGLVPGHDQPCDCYTCSAA